jgi:type II secretory pathway pseudopilin PulG
VNRQAINLLGALVVALIVLLGALIGVLPRWQAARSAESDRQAVATQNQTQQMLIAAFAQQRQQLPQLQAQVAALKQQIPSEPRLDQLITLATGLPDGATLQTIGPGGSDTTAAAGASPDANGFQAVPVTMTIALQKATDAPSVLDKLRAGPRLLAIDEATVDPAGAGQGAKKGAATSTLTVVGRVFTRQEATS